MIPLLSPSSAEDVRWIWMQGVGLDSCGKFLAAIEGLPIGKAGVATYPDGRKFVDEAAAYQSWIEGYITGVNVSAYEALGANATMPPLRTSLNRVNPYIIANACGFWFARRLENHPVRVLEQ